MLYIDEETESPAEEAQSKVPLFVVGGCECG